jgi:hypothetical protein
MPQSRAQGDSHVMVGIPYGVSESGVARASAVYL